jgi:dTMP kinase
MKNEVLKNFIVFEGLDGSGTSTQSKLLSQNIKNSYLTFEPTDSKIGSLIRNCLKKKIKFDMLTLAFLFSADRSDHLYADTGIINKCKNNQIVISDRYLFSSLAYQSIDLPFEKIIEFNNSFPLPEILFFLDTSLDVCKNRINIRGNDEELYESQILQKNILNNYLKTFSFFKKTEMKIIKLNGDLSKEQLIEQEIKVLRDNKVI